jgi:6-pyruvoyltetrahydropterin/6-carboxytetrahydropterin synthase
MSTYKIKIFKESIHFNAAHFTIFSDQQRERLHGHDYFLKAAVESTQDLENGLMVNYRILKDFLSTLSSEVDEYFLLPELSPFLEIKHQAQNIEFFYQGDFFSIPKNDVKLLPLINISNELLLNWFYENLCRLWQPIPHSIISIELELENGRGQAISQKWSLL